MENTAKQNKTAASTGNAPQAPSAKRIEPVRIEPEQTAPEETVETKQDAAARTVPRTVSRIPSVRTFKSDVDTALQKKGQSLTKIALAAQRKRRATTRGAGKDEHGKTIATSIIAIVLVLASIGALGAAGWFFFFRAEPAPEPEYAIPPQNILFAEKQQVLMLERTSRAEIRTAVRTELANPDLRLGAIEQIIFGRMLTNADGTQQRTAIPLTEILPAAAPGMPARVLRALDSEALYGIHMLEQAQPFVIARVASYEQVFAGMLAWESSLIPDIDPLFQFETLPASTQFRDALIKNRDVRVVRTAAGEPLLLYAFPDKQTLIITGDERTFIEALNRLASPPAAAS